MLWGGRVLMFLFNSKGLSLTHGVRNHHSSPTTPLAAAPLLPVLTPGEARTRSWVLAWSPHCRAGR